MSSDTSSVAQRFLAFRAAQRRSLLGASAPTAPSVRSQSPVSGGSLASRLLAWRRSQRRTAGGVVLTVVPPLAPPSRPPILSSRPSFQLSSAILSAPPVQPSGESVSSSSFLSWRANARFASGSSSARHFRGQSSPDARPLWLRESISFQDYPLTVRDYISEKRPGSASHKSRLGDAKKTRRFYRIVPFFIISPNCFLGLSEQLSSRFFARGVFFQLLC